MRSNRTNAPTVHSILIVAALKSEMQYDEGNARSAAEVQSKPPWLKLHGACVHKCAAMSPPKLPSKLAQRLRLRQRLLLYTIYYCYRDPICYYAYILLYTTTTATTTTTTTTTAICCYYYVVFLPGLYANLLVYRWLSMCRQHEDDTDDIDDFRKHMEQVAARTRLASEYSIYRF